TRSGRVWSSDGALPTSTGRGELPGRARITEWRWSNNLVLPTDRLTLQGISPAAARDLVAGGDGGFEWLDGGPFEGTREASGFMRAEERRGGKESRSRRW